MVKENCETLCIIVTDLINTCFQTAVYPALFKKAIVIPLHKKGDPENLSNYRGISILPPISKIIEKCLKTRILKYFISKKLFTEFQFGFQSGISTQDAILYLTEKMYANLNDESSTLAVFIDFSKCFNTLKHNILIRKLEAYGIRGLPLMLFVSYLSDRYQAVRVNGTTSEFKLIRTGIPQGSVLGPILYLIFVFDLPSISNLFSICLFADDTTLIFENPRKNELVRICNEGMKVFYSWCCANRLSINISKTNVMLFSNSLCPFDVYLNDIRIQYASSVRFLGIIIDDKLKFNLQINNFAQKISKNAGVLYKLKQYVPNDTLVCIYRSFVECYLNYCTLIYGNAYTTHLRPLQIAQKKCIRIIANKHPDARSIPIFSEFRLLKFLDIYKLNLGVYMHKNIDKFSSYIMRNPYSTRSGTYYIPGNQRLTLTKNQSIVSQGPSCWNNMLDSLKNCSSIYSFKKSYKKHLFSLYNG